MILHFVVSLLCSICQMRLIKFWIWLLPVILVTTVVVNVYLLSYIHNTKCEYNVFLKIKKMFFFFIFFKLHVTILKFI